MAEASRNRLAKLRTQATFNGIDFVEVLNTAQTQLRVHFLHTSPGGEVIATSVTAVSISGGDSIRDVAAEVTGWDVTPTGYPTIDLTVAQAGDFSNYTLTLLTTGPTLDPFFDHITFSFKVECPAPFDTEQSALVSAPQHANPPTIDYLARDFDSFRRALFDFSAAHYPAWQERSEADFGVMFMEALASLADDLSYQQDRIAAEAWIETATQRRSLVRLARLVDYEPAIATAARTWLQFEIAGTTGFVMPAGLGVSTRAPDGTLVEFETGTRLADATGFAVHPAWNRLEPYFFDDEQRCLPTGATQMWIARPSEPLSAGRRVLIETPDDPRTRELVQLVHVDSHASDGLFNKPLARLVWGAQEALQYEHDLTRTTVSGNLVPATHGKRHVEDFVASRTWSLLPAPPRAIVRTGANGTIQFLYTLRRGPLAWLAQGEAADSPRPEIRVVETSSSEDRHWPWLPSLLTASEFEKALTIEPVAYRAIDPTAGIAEFDGADGATLRFGDGVFGAIPRDGARFEVTYRAGGGAHGNVAPDTLTRPDPGHPVTRHILAVRNPMPADGGRDEESADSIREAAPQRFRVHPQRAVRPEDYARAAMTLPAVQRAATQFRHTGSWLSVFTTVDPASGVSLSDQDAITVSDLLNRYRLAGYESFVVAPRYAPFELEVTVCAHNDAFRDDVKHAVIAALGSAIHADGSRGHFHPDRFTFGVALERSGLEAAIQAVPNVDGVVELRYRRRGHTPGFVRMPDAVHVAADEIVRVDNDPDHPEHGLLHVEVRGGK
jgi:hypothetical protein